MKQKTFTSKLIVANQQPRRETFLKAAFSPSLLLWSSRQLKKKTIHQETKEATDGDTIQGEDSKQAAEEGSTQENVLKQKKNKTEVSCVKNKLKAILQSKGKFIFLAYMDFWTELVGYL